MGDDTKPASEGLDQSSEPSNGGDETPPALRVIGAFGGIRPMANKLEVPVSTVQGWKERGVIPETRHDEIRAAAKAHEVALDDGDLDASAEAPPETPSAAAAETETESAPETATTAAQPWAPAATDEESTVEDEPPAIAPPIAPSIAAATQGSAGSGQGGRPSWVPGFVLGALVFAVGAGGAVLTKDIWATSEETAAEGGADGAVSEQLAALESRLAAIEAQPGASGLPDNLATADDLARLEGEIAALSGGTDATADLAAELKDLDARLAALGASASDNANASAEATTATTTALGGLSGEVAAIEASLQEIRAAIDELKARNDSQDALLWSAVGTLRDAMRYTGPFSEQLADVSRLAGDRAEFQEALAELKPLAGSGVANLTELQREFPATARDIVAAGYGDSDDGVLGDVLNRVSQVVTVRPVGEVEGDGPGAIVARAEGHLDQGDLAAALEELKGLPEDASRAADTWRQRAQQRVAADAAITRLNGLLAGQLATGG